MSHSQKISQTTVDKDVNKYFSCFGDDVKVFDPSEEGELARSASGIPMLQIDAIERSSTYTSFFDLDIATKTENYWKTEYDALPV